MIKIDGHFLEEVGLAGMPESQKQQFIEHTQEELERRVGEKISEGLSLEQIREFEGIMAKDREVMLQMLKKVGDYKSDPLLRKVIEKSGAKEVTLDMISEYLSVKWVQMNRPDYAEVANAVAEELKEEIKSSSTQILNG